MKYFIANWKARTDGESISRWSDEFIGKLNSETRLKDRLSQNKLQIIICPPFPFFHLLAPKFNLLQNVGLGSQDISAFDEGTYTGEVTAKMLKDTVRYTIVGHSERRHFLNESESLIEKKVRQALIYNIRPILCLRGIDDIIYPKVKIITYEPVGAIWPGKNEDPPKVVSMKKKLSLPQQTVFIYGGSVNEDNVRDYLATKEIDGFLIGNASLDPQRFLAVITQALSLI